MAIKKLCRNRRCHYADPRQNASAFSVEVLTRRRKGFPTSQRSAYRCLWRANLSSRVSAVSRRRHRWCTSVLLCHVRCTYWGNETMCLRPGAIVRKVDVNGGASLKACETTLSLLRNGESGRNKRMKGAKERGGNSRNRSGPLQTTTVQTKDDCVHQGNKR